MNVVISRPDFKRSEQNSRIDESKIEPYTNTDNIFVEAVKLNITIDKRFFSVN